LLEVFLAVEVGLRVKEIIAWQGNTKETSVDNRVEYICEPKEASGRGCHCIPPRYIW
jgi:hypothetical protein